MPEQQTFHIDKITNSIEDAAGKSFDTSVVRVCKEDLKVVLKKNGWLFNWKKEYNLAERKVYKLTIENENAIQGLISIETMSGYIEMHLVENAPHNYGINKHFAGVAGNLVAFACKESFENGFDGYVAFTSKTKLVEHYINTLGAQLIYGRERMGIFTKAAENL